LTKTYEFIFTKPRTRSYILMRKLMVGAGFLVVFSLMNIPLSMAGIVHYRFRRGRRRIPFVHTYTVALLFVGLLFFAVGAVLVRTTSKT
jgi:cytochrome c biogenesis protein CcdA